MIFAVRVDDSLDGHRLRQAIEYLSNQDLPRDMEEVLRQLLYARIETLAPQDRQSPIMRRL